MEMHYLRNLDNRNDCQKLGNKNCAQKLDFVFNSGLRFLWNKTPEQLIQSKIMLYRNHINDSIRKRDIYLPGNKDGVILQ